jgi:hypothetical protein
MSEHSKLKQSTLSDDPVTAAWREILNRVGDAARQQLAAEQPAPAPTAAPAVSAAAPEDEPSKVVLH